MSFTPLPLRILGTGKALPPDRVDSTALDERMGHRRGWVERRSGVRSRHLAGADIVQSSLAAEALCDAITRAGIRADSIDLVLSTAAIPQQALPCMAGAIAEQAGIAQGTPAYDINASCLGFLVGLHLAANLLHSGAHQRIAIVASDLASRGVDWRKPEASLIFGDGAAAAIVEASAAGAGIRAWRMQTWPQARHLCEIRGCGTLRSPRTGMTEDDFLFRMNGPRLFRETLKHIDPFMHQLLADRFALTDMDLVIPHQASHLGMQHLTHHLGLDPARIVNIFAEHGNQVSASLPTALHEAFVHARMPTGSHVLLLGTAAGISLCAMVLRT